MNSFEAVLLAAFLVILALYFVSSAYTKLFTYSEMYVLYVKAEGELALLEQNAMRLGEINAFYYDNNVVMDGDLIDEGVLSQRVKGVKIV